MNDENLLSIGAFGMLSGLSINALRHYDEVGLLPPAYVDPDTGYRRYRSAQLKRAGLICALRGIDLPVEEIRRVLEAPDDNGSTAKAVLTGHRDRLAERARAIGHMTEITERYLENGLTMPDTATPRISQVTINATDLGQTVKFYEAAFEATYNEEISSLEFGTWPAGNFCLLTIAHEPNDHGQHQGPAGTARFGLLVADIDAVHRRALDAGAREHYAPVDRPWKPRSSCVIDPGGNWIDLYQA
ncbi:MAG TPA: VOC family protein [Trebonia sp.]|nr:VOC family protein [Trebonia sp.]